MTVPSSGSWSNSSGSVRTHWPAPTHRLGSAMIFIPTPSPGDRHVVDAVDRGVGFERQFVHRYGQPQRGNAFQQRVEDDLQLGAGQILAEALVRAEPERDVVPGRPVDVEVVRLAERVRV